jgi:hypothetical protein
MCELLGLVRMQARINTKWGKFAGGMCGAGLVIICPDMQPTVEPPVQLRSMPFYMDQMNDYTHATFAALSLLRTKGNFEAVRDTQGNSTVSAVVVPLRVVSAQKTVTFFDVAQSRRHYEREAAAAKAPPSKVAAGKVAALQRALRELYREPLKLPADNFFKVYCAKVRSVRPLRSFACVLLGGCCLHGLQLGRFREKNCASPSPGKLYNTDRDVPLHGAPEIAGGGGERGNEGLHPKAPSRRLLSPRAARPPFR